MISPAPPKPVIAVGFVTGYEPASQASDKAEASELDLLLSVLKNNAE